MTKVLFIGVGSIAKRHIRNLHNLWELSDDNFTIDVLRSGKGRPLEDDIRGIITNEYSSDDDIPKDYDAIFITNPTSRHFDTISKYVSFGRNMFIEKPVFDKTSHDLNLLPLNPTGIYYVACPLRYTSVLQYIHDNVPCEKAIAVRAISSSYLPDWRPGTDYRDTYSAHRSMGGGVSIDLIHEWDYLSWLFGEPTVVHSLIGKFSGLEIDSDDSALYIGNNATTTFELHLDYYGRKTLRSLDIFLPDETIHADIAQSFVEYMKSGKRVELKEDRNSFQTRELIHFFDIIDGKCENDNTIDHAVKVLKIAKGETK